jgi:hypothetical protein
LHIPDGAGAATSSKADAESAWRTNSLDAVKVEPAIELELDSH